MAQPLVLSYQITDALGVTATHLAYINAPTTVTLANLQTFANDYTPLLDAVTDGEITFIEVRVPLTITGAKSAPVAGSEVERTGLFNFEQAGTRYKFGEDVPSIAAALITNGRIDLSNAAITNWVSFLEATTLGITFVSKFANALIALLDAVITFRKRRKLENKRSYEVA
jgi:hypothetical protein